MRSAAAAAVILGACTSADLSVADLSSATVDVTLGQFANGLMSPSADVLVLPSQGGCPALAPDVTALFAGQPATVDSGGQVPSDTPFAGDTCAVPSIHSHQPLPGGELQLIVSDPDTDASFVIDHGAAARTVTWGDSFLVRGQTATLTWSPATDNVRSAAIACVLTAEPSVQVMSVAATITNRSQLSFVVPDSDEHGALTCSIQATVEVPLLSCDGFAKCVVEDGEPTIMAPAASLPPKS